MKSVKGKRSDLCFPRPASGCLLTCAALVVATHHLRKGNREKLNQAFRWRIYFQGITVVGALGGLWYYDSNAAAPVPPPPSREAKDPTAQAYHSIATAPGRPPTNSQVAKEQNRQATTRHEWQDRFRAAQNREDGAEDQKKLEQALLKGVNLEEIDQQPAAAEATTASASAMMTPAARADIEERRRNRPIIGQDGRDRRGGGG